MFSTLRWFVRGIHRLRSIPLTHKSLCKEKQAKQRSGWVSPRTRPIIENFIFLLAGTSCRTSSQVAGNAKHMTLICRHRNVYCIRCHYPGKSKGKWYFTFSIGQLKISQCRSGLSLLFHANRKRCVHLNWPRLGLRQIPTVRFSNEHQNNSGA